MYGRYAHDEHQPYLLESAVPLSPSAADATLPRPSASLRYRIEEGCSRPRAPRSSARRPFPPTRRRLQVGAGTDLRWDLSGLDMRGTLGRPRVALASLRRIDLHVSGGGRRADTFHPSRNGYKLYGGALLNGFYFISRTTQSVKLWAQVGDARSNVVTIRVRRRPGGCSNAF